MIGGGGAGGDGLGGGGESGGDVSGTMGVMTTGTDAPGTSAGYVMMSTGAESAWGMLVAKRTVQRNAERTQHDMFRLEFNGADRVEVHPGSYGLTCTWCTNGRKQAPAYGVRGRDGRRGRHRCGDTSNGKHVVPHVCDWPV
jgi:hypothetical protein